MYGSDECIINTIQNVNISVKSKNTEDTYNSCCPYVIVIFVCDVFSYFIYIYILLSLKMYFLVYNFISYLLDKFNIQFLYGSYKCTIKKKKWANEKRTSREIKNILLLATDNEGRAVLHMAVKCGRLQLLCTSAVQP